MRISTSLSNVAMTIIRQYRVCSVKRRSKSAKSAQTPNFWRNEAMQDTVYHVVNTRLGEGKMCTPQFHDQHHEECEGSSTNTHLA